MTIEATAFIPAADMTGTKTCLVFSACKAVLRYLRFAIDPNDDTFYFGALGEF